MCIYLSYNVLFALIFMAGLVLGTICASLTAFRKPVKPIDYDGTNGKGYQPRPTKPLPEKPHK